VGARDDDLTMTVRTTTDTQQILGRVDPVLMADPVRNTIFDSVRAHLRQAGAGGWCAYNSVAIAARSSVTHPIALSQRWPDLGRLAEVIGELPSVAGLRGPVPIVDALVGLLELEPTQRIAERLYRLDRLVEPVGVAGRARLASTDDLDLVTAWVEPYTLETFGRLPADFDARVLATVAIGRSRTWLWLVSAGVPVSMAARRPPAAGVARIGPVYTPPEHRRHGYGSAATARAAFDILDGAALPVLYTDLANPTSNKVYRALGFRPVADRLSVTFD
jgi:GNAT superfamily N-acetyltransferase